MIYDFLYIVHNIKNYIMEGLQDMIEIPEPLDSYKEIPGPILLLAGPGTGKTTQLAKRIKFLIEEQKVDPNEIAVITFTNEAAGNMRKKLADGDNTIILGKIPKIIITMHGLGNAIISSHHELLGLMEGYGILTEDHQQSVLLKDAAMLAKQEISKSKIVEDCRSKGICNMNKEEEKCLICTNYRNLLRKCMVIDHDEQIFLACYALKNFPEIRSEWQLKTRYLLVDEYQDINQAQFEFIQLLTDGQEDGLFAVGDDDQSIYSFRGGSPKYISEFGNHFGEFAKIGRLSKSWRCPEHILRGARSMVKTFYKESVMKPEPTFEENSNRTNKIIFYDVPTEKWEANLIASITEEKVNDNSVTIIIPNKKYFPPIRDELKKRRITYNYRNKINEHGIMRMTLLSDWAENRRNNIYLRQLIDLIIENHDQLIQSLPIDHVTLTQKREIASEQISQLWDEVNARTSLWEILSNKIDAFPFLAALKNECLDHILELLDKSTSGKRVNLPMFLEKCGRFVAPGRSPKGIISEIREWKAERLGSAISTSYSPVNIYNLPSSKGLEGDVIFVVGASEELMPSLNKNIEEQCRLFYVAMTRARRELYIFSARNRPASITFHPASYQLSKSRFINAIPKENIDLRYIQKKKTK